MAEKLELEILSANAPASKIDIKQIYVPAVQGMAGILEDHIPFITLLKMGELSYTDQQGTDHVYFVREGVLQVHDNRVTLLSETLENGESLSKQEVQTRVEEVNREIIEATQKILPASIWNELLQKKAEWETKSSIIQTLGKQSHNK